MNNDISILSPEYMKRFFYKLNSDQWNRLISSFQTEQQAILVVSEINYADWQRILFNWYNNIKNQTFSFISISELYNTFNTESPSFSPQKVLDFFHKIPYDLLRTLMIDLCFPIYYEHLIKILKIIGVDLQLINSFLIDVSYIYSIGGVGVL